MERSRQGGVRARCAAAPARQHRAPGAVYQTLLALAAVTLWVLLFVAFAAIGGCSQRTGPMQAVCCSRTMNQCGQGHWLGPEPRASLIFTAEPGLTPIPAEEIARADWPTTPGATSYGQTVNYQEYWYDSQRLGPCNYNYGYRSFTSVRTGQRSSD
jgi:hypothetical protein